jgi:hypothetical protein
LVPWLLIAGIAILQLVTMPAFHYRGDNFVARAASISLLQTGDTGIPLENRHQLADLVDEGDRFFVLNHSKQKLYSKYGIGDSLVYLPPMLAELAYSGKLALLQRTRSLLLFINLYNIVFGLLTALILYRLARLFSNNRTLVAVFVVLSIYTSFLWYYLRSPTMEVYQVPMILGAALCCLQFIRSERWVNLTIACLLVGYLTLMKNFFVILFVAVWFVPLLRFRKRSDLVMLASRSSVYLLIPSIAIMILVLVVNQYKFGSVFETGYTANSPLWEVYSPRYLPQQALRYLLLPGNYNIFLHYPLMLLAVLSLPRFLKRHRTEAIFLLTAFAVFFLGICCFSELGEYCYGPRLMLPILVLGSLPLVVLLEAWYKRARQRSLMHIAAAMLVSLGLGYSALLQVYVASLDYFAYHEAVKRFEPFEIAEIDRYFEQVPQRGLIYRDIIHHADRTWRFPPLDLIARYGPPGRGTLVKQHSEWVDQLAASNFFFWSSSKTESQPGVFRSP